MQKPKPVEPMPNLDARYAWSQVDKVEPPKRSATDRVSDFLDIYTLLDAETARQQAMRCIQCPEPTCVEGCPVNNRIPEWMGLVAEGRFLEASQILQASSCMEEIFSRVCAHPCEPRCILEGRGDPVAINAIERFLHDYGFSHGGVDVTLAPLNGGKVAVMNAGPCGLTCAYDLARNGYAVTVFDHRSEPGGLLAHGIPSFRMEHGLLQRRLDLLKKLGVAFRLGVKPGLEPTLRELRANYDAVFFGAALGQVKPLDFPGAALRGVHQGLAFIMQSSLHAPIEAAPIEVRGKRVVVLGGGDVAMDCLRTALRCAASEVVCLYRRGVAQLSANWNEFQNAREEGARFEFLAWPVALLGDASGAVTAVRCVRTRLAEPEPDGRPRPVPVPGTEFDVPADVVLAALGFISAPFAAEGDLKEIPVNSHGCVIVDENLMTGLPGVFAGGTLVRGAAAFLDAVTDARKAARSIHQYLALRRPGVAATGAAPQPA
jgi:glutamate synthase (NADPH) small chain